MRERSQQLESISVFENNLVQANKLASKFLDLVSAAPGYPQTNDFLMQNMQNDLNSESRNTDQLFNRQISGGIETASGNFMGFVPGGGLPIAAIADFIAAITNRFSGFHFAAPGAASTELNIMNWLRNLLGYPKSAGGCLTSGGTIATVNCLLPIKNMIAQKDYSNCTVYLSQEAHHANVRALKILGFDSMQIRHVQTDAYMRMKSSELLDLVKSDLSKNLKPILIIATAGSTNCGIIDPLNEISKIANANKIWLHVDAAYGGFFMLTENGKSQLCGIEKSDSIVLDPHKGLFMPYGVGACLVRDREGLRKSLNEDAPYLNTPLPDEINYSPADYSIELTRHNRAPRVQLALDVFGEEIFKYALTEKLLLANYFYESLSQIEGLDIFMKPQLTVVLFKLKTNEQTNQLLKRLLENGSSHISQTTIKNTLWARVCILNFRTHVENVDILLANISAIARAVLNEVC